MEMWRKIEDDRVMPIYEISNYGNVRNSKTGRLRKTRLKRGYCVCSFSGKNKNVTFFIHRLVLTTFAYTKNCTSLVVNHMNCIRSDNRLGNLEWLTRAENIAKRFETVNMNKVEYILKQHFDAPTVSILLRELREGA